MPFHAFLLLLLILVLAALADDKLTPQELQRKAADVVSIWEASVPFQLEAEVAFLRLTIGEAKGKYVEIRGADRHWRSHLQVSSYVQAAGGDGETGWKSNSGPPPARVREFLQAFRRLITPFSLVADSIVDERKIDGKKLFCLRSKRSLLLAGCVDPVSGAPVRIYESAWEFRYSDYRTFAGKTFPGKIEVFEGPNEVIRATVALNQMESTLDFPPAPPDAVRVPDCPVPGDSGAKLLKEVRPIYPMQAKANRESGVVGLLATITSQGDLQNLQIMQSAGPRLDQAAFDAVRHWKYTPARDNCGHPVELDIMITVSFWLQG